MFTLTLAPGLLPSLAPAPKLGALPDSFSQSTADSPANPVGPAFKIYTQDIYRELERPPRSPSSHRLWGQSTPRMVHHTSVHNQPRAGGGQATPCHAVSARLRRRPCPEHRPVWGRARPPPARKTAGAVAARALAVCSDREGWRPAGLCQAASARPHREPGRGGAHRLQCGGECEPGALCFVHLVGG